MDTDGKTLCVSLCALGFKSRRVNAPAYRAVLRAIREFRSLSVLVHGKVFSAWSRQACNRPICCRLILS